jgi:medium-chain acyl-[acyl-carrier-protein] hydrolase
MMTGVPEAKSYFAPRSMIALDKDGNEYFRASTMWAIVDYETRMPVRVGDYYAKMGFAKDADFVDQTLRREPKIDTDRLLSKEPMSVFTPQIFFYDCDINNHINNIVYLDWLLRTVPVSYMKEHRPSMIDIMWIHEVHIDDTVEVSMYEIEKDYFGFVIRRKSDDSIVCSAEIRFNGEKA